MKYIEWQPSLDISSEQFKSSDVIIVKGGDGTLLECIHFLIDNNLNKKIYGLNYGTYGFLMNDKKSISEIDFDNLSSTTISPLKIRIDTDSGIVETYSINDVYVNRAKSQACKLKIDVDNITRIESFSGDGIIVSTPVGSTAYNRSAGGSIIPLGSKLLNLTPICGFLPKKWSGAILSEESLISISVLEKEKRPINLYADYKEFSGIRSFQVSMNKNINIELLFDKNNSMYEKYISEQF